MTFSFNKIAATLTLSAALAAPLSVHAQESAAHARHRRAVARQRASDHRHHTGAKIVVGSAVGGAVLGGPKGALIGAGVGAGGGAIANKARENHDVHKRENADPH